MTPVLSVLIALSSGAAASDCPEGQESPKKAKGACCWAGQAWDRKAGACQGTPSACPEGMIIVLADESYPGSCEPRPEVRRDDPELEGIFITSSTDPELVGGIGALIGAQGTGGLGARGSGLGGGGSAEGLGGLGTGGFGRADLPPPTPSGAALAPGLHVGEPIILGALDKALVDAGVARVAEQLAACTEGLRAEDAAATGKVVVKFVIDQQGKVTTANTKASTLGHAGTEDCLNAELLKAGFEAPVGGGIAIVSYPLVIVPLDG